MRKLLLLLLLILPLSLSAGEWILQGTDSSVNLPEGWMVYSAEEKGRISFINPESSVVFQVTIYPGESYSSDTEMMEDHLEELAVSGKDLSRFYYRGRTCSLADVSLDAEGSPVRGWFLFVERDDFDYYLTAITPPEIYEETLPLILSCLDGFSPDKEARSEPGAVSTLIAASLSREGQAVLSYPAGELEYLWDEGREEAVQLLIEREAGILSAYREPEIFDTAWKRYYRMIYRSSAVGLEGLSQQMSRHLHGMSDREKAELLLGWLQDFEYGSTDRFSDLLSPMESLLAETGDCDSLGLIYVILLNQLGIPSVLMVSREYSHALAAVSVEGKGAGFELDGKRYIVAEMTKKVDLGRIAAEQADLSKWVLVNFDDYTEGVLNPGQ